MSGMDRYYKRKKEKQGTSVSSSSGGMDRYYKKQYYNSIDTSGVDDKYLNSFVSDVNSFIGDYDGYKLSYGDVNTRLSDFTTRYDTIQAWLYQNRSNLAEDSYNSLSDALQSVKGVLDTASNRHSEWGSEEAYNDYAGKIGFDLDAGWSEIEELTAQRDEYTALKQRFNDILNSEMSRIQAAYVKKYGSQGIKLAMEAVRKNNPELAEIEKALEAYGDYSLEDAEKAIASKTDYYNQAKEIQDPIKAMNSEDFDEKSQYVSTKKGDSFWDTLTSDYFQGYDDITYEYVNNTGTVREDIEKLGNVNQFLISGGLGAYFNDSTQGEMALEEMTEDEVKIYNYFYSTEGKDRANEYLNSLKDTLLWRKATKNYEDGWDTNAFTQLFYGAVAGLDQFYSGFENLDNIFTGEAPDSSYRQYMSQMAREDLGDNGFKLPEWLGGASIGQVGYDLINTGANMAPSIGLSFIPYAGPVLSLATTGVSAAGNAYEDGINNLGMSTGEAQNYSVLVGASEAVLQYFLGGITKLGGKVSGKAIGNFASKIDNVIIKAAVTVGGNMASEGLEEALQTALEPAFKALVTGDEFEGAEWDEILYSALLGALSAGVMEGSTTVSGLVDSNIKIKERYGDGSPLVNEALGVATEGSDLKTLADKYKGKLDGGKSLSGLQMLQLDEAIRKNDATAIKKAALGRLGELGETTDVTPIAEVLTKYALGEKLTSQDNAILNNSDYGHQVLAELNKDNIESGGLANNWAKNIGTRRVSPEAYNNDPIYELAKAVTRAREEAKKDSVAKTLAESPNAKEAKISVSDNGKTVYYDAETDSHYDVDIKRVVSTDGGVKVELDNGKTVSAKDLEFGTWEEGIVYEMVARMEVTPETANELISSFKPKNAEQVTKWFNAVPLAYQYGMMGHEVGLKDINLPENLKRIAYNRGRIDAIEADKANTKSAPKKRSDATSTKKNGIIYEDGFVYDESTANDLQKKGMIGAEVIDKMSNLEVHVFASEEQADGTRVATINGKRVTAPNGYFVDGNKIYIDYYAGDGGEGAMLYTMSHEITHYIREWNAEGFRELADFLIAEYGKNGVNVEELLQIQREAIKERYAEEEKELPSEAKLADMAYEELVADAMSEMFADPNAYEKLAKFKKKNFKAWQKLGEAIKHLLDKLKTALGIYKEKAPVAQEALAVRGFSVEAYNKLQDLYIKAFVKADANYEAAKNNGTADKYLKNRDIAFNLRAKKSHQAKLAEQYSKDASVDLDTIMQRYNKIISIWESLGGELDSKFLTEWNNKVGKDRAFTVFKAQAGYKYNVELSSMCKKGVPLFEAIDTIVKEEVMKELDTKVLGKEEKEILYDLLKEHNFEIPCAICYVEQACQREGVIIDSFLNGKIEKNNAGKVTTFKLGWNEVLKSVEKEMKALGVDYTFASVDRSIATDKYVPSDITMDEATQNAFYKALRKVANKEIARYNKAEGKSRKLVTDMNPSAIKSVFSGTLPSNLKIFKVLFTDPSSRLMLESDLLYSSMTTHNLATSHNALYSLFNSQGGVSGYKTKQGTVVYWGDILGKKWSPSKVRAEGGIRNQSNSDFQMYTLLDQVQMYIDFTAKGYYLQAYTKVLSELKLLGLSRAKQNASLIPAVYEYRNADGSVDVETTRANAGLDKNGNPLFDDIEGINHKEAFMLIEDAEYSKSIGGICIGYSDAHILKLLDDSRIQQIIGFHDKTDDPDKRYRGARYAKNYNGLNEAVNNKDGKTVHIGFNPFIRKAEKKFTFNSKTETYEGSIEYNGKTYVADDIPKLAADMYLEMCKEKDYKPAYKDFASHENYYKLLADFSLYDSQGHYAPHRKVAYNMPDKVPYLDINGKKQYMPTKDYIKAELEKELKVRDSISEALADKSENGLIPQFVKRVNESKQSEAKLSSRKSKKDSLGNELSAEQQEYFKDSKVRDENGNLMVVYHGSQSKFTIFKQSKIGAHGNAHGRGFYFTEDEGLASSYYKEGGQLLKGYLDIKNPVSEEKLTIKKSALEKFIKALCEAEARYLVEHDSYKSIREALPDTFISNYVYTYGMSIADAYREVTDMVYSSCENDVDIIAELYNAGARGLALEKAYEVLGYDGAIYTHPDGVHEYVSFVSSQFKSIENKTPTSDPDIRYSGRKTKRYSNDDYSKPITIEDIEILRSIGGKSINAFTSEDIEKAQKWAYKFYQELGTKSPFFRAWFGDWRGSDKNKAPYLKKIKTASVTSAAAGSKLISDGFKNGTLFKGNATNSDTGYEINIGRQVYQDTLTYANRTLSRDKDVGNYSARLSLLLNMKEIAETAILLDTVTLKKDESNADRTFVHKFYATAKVNNGYYIVKLTVDEFNSHSGTIRRAYNVNNIEISPIAVSQVYSPASTIGDIGEYLSKSIIADLFALVKSQDNSFKPNSVNPLLLNEDGTPKVFYHGTNAEFSVFDIEKAGQNWNGDSRLGKGFYFAHTEKEALQWTEGTKVVKAYLKLENPLDVNAPPPKNIAKEIDKYIANKIASFDENNSFISKEQYIKNLQRIKDMYMSDVSMFIDNFKYDDNGKMTDGIREFLTALDYDGIISKDEVVAFYPEQIKSATDNIGTFDKAEDDIHYSLRGKGAVSNRTLLANALESVAENDIEKNKLAQYKNKIALIESEQAKLTEIRVKAQELRFTKGRTPSETKTMRDLDAEATQIANRISTYDKQLLNLESTTALKNVLEREKAMLRKRLEQKSKEAIKKQKEKDAETVRELMNRHTESRQKAIEGRHKTEMRHKIKNVVSDLNKLLLNPTKDQHVPIGLQGVVAEALDVINMDTMNAEERVAYYNDLISKSSDPDEIAMLKKKRDFFEYRDMNFKERITALKNAYAEFKESDDPLIRNAHDEAIENLIKNTADEVGNKSLKDMSYAQLESVYDMYKAILATVRNSNKMFKESRQATVTENSESVKVQVKEAGGHKERVLKAFKFIKKFGWNMLKPVTAMKVIGSKTFAELFDNVRAAEDVWAVDVNEAKEFYKAISDKYGYNKWDFKTQHSFKDSRGEEFSISLEQMMSLYAYSKRDQADKHLEFGGFIFDDAIEVTERKGKFGIPLKYEVNDANPHRLGLIQMAEIIGKLTQEQKGFIDEMQTYLSDVMGAKGNEVSLALYDIKLYKEKNYFPLKTARYFREFDPEKSGTPKVKNAGFSKKTVPQAGNPIVLSNFMDVWASHVNDMSMYHAFVLPLEDFMRVYNYSSTAGGYDSVQQYIKNAYGAEANQYIERLMDDLNGGARVDPTAGVMNKGLALFKKASVFASASVVIQQPSAIARAWAYINPKYFVTSTGSALNLAKHKEVWAEVKKYAPVAVIKEMGYFDTGMGRSTVEWIKGNKTIKDKVDDALSKAPAMADELSWSYIWLAVKNEIKATTNLKVGSEEFLKRCGERFTEIITNTQVYDSVLSRSGMMRSKDTGMKMATAFMAEPTTTVNMMVDGIIQGTRGNVKFTASTVGAVTASIILNSILVALVYAARDDDEDETYAEKYIGSLTTELIDGFNPLTYIPFVKDIWSIAQGYDVERSDMSVVSDLWQTVEGLFNEDKSGWDKVADVSGAVCSIFGFPLKNILRDAKGMYNLFETVTSDTPTTSAGIGDAIGDSFKSSIPLWDRLVESESNSDKLYEAILSGDQKQIDRIKGKYDDENAIESAMRAGLREHDPRIKEAAQARYNGDISKYTRIAKEIIAEGNFSQDTVVGAINAEINAIKRGETTEKEATEERDEVTSIYSASDINTAFDNGDTATALEIINDLIETKVANGMEEKNAKSSLRSSMTSYWKPLYKEAYQSGDTSEMARIRQILYASGLYGSANEVVKTTQSWLKD